MLQSAIATMALPPWGLLLLVMAGLLVVGCVMETTAALIMQAVLGTMRLRSLGAELNGVPIDGAHIYDFCVSSLTGRRDPA